MLQCRSEFEVLADSERLLSRVTCEWHEPCWRALPAVLSAMKSAIPNHISMALTSFFATHPRILRLPGWTKRRIKQAHTAISLRSESPFSTFYKCTVFIIRNPTTKKASSLGKRKWKWQRGGVGAGINYSQTNLFFLHGALENKCASSPSNSRGTFLLFFPLFSRTDVEIEVAK